MSSGNIFDQCAQVATESDDPHRQVGCIILDSDGNQIATGTNKLPRGCAVTEHRIEKPHKYTWIEHAERNAIFSAAKRGVSLEGSTIFVNWWPCVDCTRAIIQSGIQKIVAPSLPDFEHPRWGQQFRTSFEMVEETGLNYTILE